MIRWEHGPYVVAFTSRLGGVSGGAFESLNLGALTDDDPLNVVENRRLACEAVDADASTATMAWQHHSAEVRRAEPRGIVTPGTQFDRCDGLWTDVPGQAMMLLAADCLPIALGRANGSHPALGVLHAGWRGLLDGIVDSAAKILGPGFAAVVGPTIGPCCYEVGDEVASPFRARFGDGIVIDRILDLWTAAEQAALDAGASTVDRLDFCTRCRGDLFFSERRTGRPRGTQGVLGLVR
jgi:YfiH family protein